MRRRTIEKNYESLSQRRIREFNEFQENIACSSKTPKARQNFYQTTQVPVLDYYGRQTYQNGYPLYQNSTRVVQKVVSPTISLIVVCAS